MEIKKVELAAGGQTQSEMKIQRGIFQGDFLSPLLFVISMMQFKYILKKNTGAKNLQITEEKLNHLMYTDK